ncbi:MAG: tetratricopeptide repeat protein, partial [Candidatus Latescibacterota bacterium]
GVVMLALYGTITFYEGQMLMMWLGTLINISMLYVLHQRQGDSGHSRYAIAGGLLGLSALARANILIFLPVVFVWVLFLSEEKRRRSKALVLVLGVLVTILPATLHNYVAAKDFVLITSNGGVNFFIGNGEEATGIFYPPKGITFETDAAIRSHVERLFGRDMKASEISRYWFGQSFEFIKSNPGREVLLLLRKAAIFFNGYEIPQIESFDITRGQFGALRLLFVNFWAIVSLGLVGMVFALRDWRKYFLLHGYVLSFAFSIILFFVTARYRIQIAPILCLFAAYALVVVLPRAIKGAGRNVVPLALFIVVVFATRPNLFALPREDVEWREHIHQARRMSTLRDHPGALEEINKAVEIHPDVADSYVQRAIILKEAGKYFEAINDYSKALEIAPELSSVRYDFAQTLRQVKMYEPAIEEYLRAIELDPVKTEAYNNLGITYLEMREYGKAIEYFRKVIEMNSNYTKAYNNLGAALAETGSTEEAVLVLERAIEIDPDYANSYKNLAMVHIQERRIKDAFEYMSKYLALKPDDKGAIETLEKLRIVIEGDTLGGGSGSAEESREKEK